MTDRAAGRRLTRDVIAIGGSAGAVSVLRRLVADLPANLPAAVLVTVHRGADLPSQLDEVLNAAGPLPAVTAAEGQALSHGRIHVAPPDHHLLIGDGHLHVRRGPRENRSRPAVDPMLRSAAVCCSTRVIGVVLSGMLNDGTAGLKAVKACQGLAVVQDPRDASAPDMPRSALDNVQVDHVAPAGAMGALLARLAAEPAPPPVAAPEQIKIEALIAAQEIGAVTDTLRLGRLSPVTCPDCHGAMVEIEEGALIRYRCHTGHAFTAESLAVAQTSVWENTLYRAMSVQQEQAVLLQHMAMSARRRGAESLAVEFEARGRSYEEGVQIIRELLARGGAANA